jgi:hypothetical protein
LTSQEAKERFPDVWATMKNGLLTPPNGLTFTHKSKEGKKGEKVC